MPNLRRPPLATAAVLALAMALSVTAAMMAGGNGGSGCGMGCGMAMVAERTRDLAPVTAEPVAHSSRVGRAAQVDSSGPATAQAAPAAWRTLDTPPPAR